MPPVYAAIFDLRRHRGVPAELPADERARAERFVREEDRERYLLGRTLIRRLCAEHLGCAPRDVEVKAAEHGKPYVFAAAERLEFNAGHSGDCVAFAWSVGGPVGIDVESLERHRSTSFPDLARTAFSPAEREVIARADPESVAETFFRIWVRKEAIVKAEGCGIAAGNALREFTVARHTAAAVEWPELVDFPLSDTPWQILAIPAPERYVAAIAISPGAELRVLAPEQAPFWR